MIALWSARDRNTCCQCEVILPVLLSNPLKWIALGPDCEYLLRPTVLARRCRPGSLQASSDSSPVSERPRTTISVGALHPGLQCWYVPASVFSQPSSTCRIAFLAECLRPSVAGPMAWNSLPDFIRDPTSSTDCFRRLLETYLFARY